MVPSDESGTVAPPGVRTASAETACASVLQRLHEVHVHPLHLRRDAVPHDLDHVLDAALPLPLQGDRVVTTIGFGDREPHLGSSAARITLYFGLIREDAVDLAQQPVALRQ